MVFLYIGWRIEDVNCHKEPVQHPKYKHIPVSKTVIEEIINAGCPAPSSKNRQPWKFIVITGNTERDMILNVRRGLDREKRSPRLPESAEFREGAADVGCRTDGKDVLI